MENRLVNFHDTPFYKGIGASFGKVPVNLTFNIKGEDEEGYLGLELFAGMDKMYRITDLEGFFQSYHKNQSYYFSKNFIFEPDHMYFAPADQTLLDWIYDMKERKPREFSLFLNAVVRLGWSEREFFFDFLWQEKDRLTFSWNRKKPRMEKDVAFAVTIEEGKEGILLSVDYKAYGDFFPLTADFRYVFFLETYILAKLSKSRKDFLKQLCGYKNEACYIQFQVNFSDIKMFQKNFLEKYEKELYISLDKNVKKRLTKNNLVSKIYFDVANIGIVSKVEFCYGEKILNPLVEEGADKAMREYEQEKAITVELKRLGFREYGKLYLLDELEKIVHLLTDDLSTLKKAGQIYYSQDFKKLYVKSPELDGLRLSEDGSVIHMNINLENVSDEELAELLEAMKTGKKYYRLRNGSIVNLAAADGSRFISLINSLEIDKNAIHDGIFELPLNRCLYLENYRKEKGLNEVKVDERFSGLLYRLGEKSGKGVEISPQLNGVLRDYQAEGVRWLKTLAELSFGGILADDMGLGKTLQVLAFLSGESKEKLPSLVVAPTSVLYNWKQEAAKFLPELKILVIEGNKESRRVLLDCSFNYDLLITSYTTLKYDAKLYDNLEFSYLFVDEAQNIKNPFTLNAEGVKSLKAKCCFALTGTPIENRLLELWSIFDFIMPGYLFSKEKFEKLYEEPIIRRKDAVKRKELTETVKPFILRRMKKEVLKELPDMTETDCMVEMTKEQKKLYIAYYKDLKRELEIKIEQNGIDRSRMEIFSALTRLRQICAHPATFLDNYEGGSGKLLFAMEIITEAMSAGHSILVFSQFTRMLKIIEKELLKNQLPCYYLDGKMKAGERAMEIENFNSDREAVFLISLKAGGTGLNLTKADIVIHFDPWWNPAVESQASSRAHRMGQKNPVQIYNLLTQGTIEEKIAVLKENKKELVAAILDLESGFLNTLDEAQIRNLWEI